MWKLQKWQIMAFKSPPLHALSFLSCSASALYYNLRQWTLSKISSNFSIQIPCWQLEQLHFRMVPTTSVAKKEPTFGHVAKKGPSFWSQIPEGSPVRLRVTGANAENRREWRLLFSHLSLISLLHIIHFLTLSCQVGTPLSSRGWPRMEGLAPVC